MARLTFTEEELKKLLFCEMATDEDGPNGPGFTRFYGFFRQDALLRARDTRRLYGIFQHYNKVLGDRMKMSDYLTFLASLFREIEDQENPVKRDNPCAEVALPMMDRTNLGLAEDHPVFNTEHRCPRCGISSTTGPTPKPTGRKPAISSRF